MKSDNLRNFTVRFLESALRRVESTAKPFYGGRLSTGEAIRRLAEERLEEIESSGPRESADEALLRMVGLWRSGVPLALADLRFLAECAHKAYQRSRRAFVSKDLLIANVSAFRDAVRLATGGKAKSIEPEERYFLKNLGTSEDIDAKTLPSMWTSGSRSLRRGRSRDKPNSPAAISMRTCAMKSSRTNRSWRRHWPSTCRRCFRWRFAGTGTCRARHSSTERRGRRLPRLLVWRAPFPPGTSPWFPGLGRRAWGPRLN